MGKARVPEPSLPVRWAQHWDPHPVCWLHTTLSHPPYNHGGLGMRTCPDGGIAITVPRHDTVIGVAPADAWRVTWSVHTHHPSTDRPPVAFGTFTWVPLDGAAFDWPSSTFALADGTKLTVASQHGFESDTRFRIESPAMPGRVVPGTDTWADLGAVEHIAARVHAWLTSNGELADKAGGDGGAAVPPP